MPKAKSNIIKKIIISAFLLIVVLIVSGWFWVANGSITPFKSGVLKIFPYPLALVNNRPLYIKDYQFRLGLAKTYASKEKQALSENELKTLVFSEMVKEAKYTQLSGKYGISFDKKEIEETYTKQAGDLQALTGKDMEENLKDFGLSAEDYKNRVLKSQVLEANLRAWFNEQKELNTESYAVAQNILNRLGAGEDFGMLAREFSQDQQSRQTQGDMGFINPLELLPEVRETLESAKIGEPKLVSSRYGLHIFTVTGKGSPGGSNEGKLHVFQIFFEPSNFNTWFETQTKNYKVVNLINI